MDEIKSVKVVLARVWIDGHGGVIFPISSTGVFIEGKRLPTMSIDISIDSDKEVLVLEVPLRIVDVEMLPVDKDWDAEVELLPEEEVDWDESDE